MKKIGAWVGIITGIISIIGVATNTIVSAADKRYIQQKSMEQFYNKKRIDELDDKIFTIQFKVNQGTATPLDKALLDKYMRERQKLLLPVE
jgi:hypothetical protein